MNKTFEVLQVYVDRYNEIDDVDHLGEIAITEEQEDFYDFIRDEMSNLGVSIPTSWDIVQDEYMGLISIYDTKGAYRYQLRSY
jgi:hypothetical protein